MNRRQGYVYRGLYVRADEAGYWKRIDGKIIVGKTCKEIEAKIDAILDANVSARSANGLSN